jgi:TP53 regulating kinase-like protein
MDKKKLLLIKKGAEAKLYLTTWHGRKVIIKKREPKKYRPKELDSIIRNYRTIHESKLIHEAKDAGVSTPIIYLVDRCESTIIMGFIKGKQMKQILRKIGKKERKKICYQTGISIGKLHKHGIIHGDLTTSNIILSQNKKIFFLDFGLGEKTEELEAKGVDLHLIKRALQSTHYQFTEECFNSIIKGYSEVFSVDDVKKILTKIREIERRGRYIANR